MSSSVSSNFLDKDEEFYPALWLLIGPMSLLCTIALALQRTENVDLLALSLISLYLSVRHRLRGLIYSFLLLVITALSKHFFFINEHLWQMGIEASVAFGCALTALAFEERHKKEAAQEAREEGQKQTLNNLEELLEETRQQTIKEQSELTERLATVQKELDDARGEISSILILNDVLRKTLVGKELCLRDSSEQDRKMAELLDEIAELNMRIDASTDLAAHERERSALTKELNAARVKQEQTHQINETLARMLALHTKQREEFEQEASFALAAKTALEEQYQELKARFEQLHAELEHHKTEALRLSHIEALFIEREQTLAQAEVKKEELKACIDRLHVELEHHGALAAKLSHTEEQLAQREATLVLLQKRVQNLSVIQSLYVQLKKQFEEKNEVLHQTRSEFFRVDTALVAIRREQELIGVEPSPLEQHLMDVLLALEQECFALEEENKLLLELVEPEFRLEVPQAVIKKKPLAKTVKKK